MARDRRRRRRRRGDRPREREGSDRVLRQHEHLRVPQRREDLHDDHAGRPGTPFRVAHHPGPDRQDALVALGQDVWESHAGFDAQHRTGPRSSDLGAPSQGTAGSVRGSNIYVGWCGPCNPADFTGSTPFQSGLVSNIGGWHALAAAGLPNRYITSIVQDPKDKQHIYVTLSVTRGIGSPAGAWGTYSSRRTAEQRSPTSRATCRMLRSARPSWRRGA